MIRWITAEGEFFQICAPVAIGISVISVVKAFNQSGGFCPGLVGGSGNLLVFLGSLIIACSDESGVAVEVRRTVDRQIISAIVAGISRLRVML